MKKKVRMYKPQFQQGGASNQEFKTHMMYNPETGKGEQAQTMEDHLRMKEMGYLHEEEMQQMQQQRKQYGGLVRKELKKKYLAGGTSTAKQNQNIDEFSNNRTGMFKNYMSNNASANIAENEAMALYDAQMQAQMQPPMPMMNYAGQVPNNNTQFSGPIKNQQNIDMMNMYGDMYKKNKQGVSNAFGQIGELAFDTIKAYDPFDITTTTKTKFTKEGKQAYKDYKNDVRDWTKGGQEGAAPASPFMARYGGTQSFIPKKNHGGPYHSSFNASDYGLYNPQGSVDGWESDPGVNPALKQAQLVNTDPDGMAWSNPNYTETRDATNAQSQFDNDFEVTPESWLYSDAENGINSRADYEAKFSKKKADGSVDLSTFDSAAADAWQAKRNKAYSALPHKDKLAYDPKAILRDGRGNIVKGSDGKSVRGEAGLDYKAGQGSSNNTNTQPKKTGKGKPAAKGNASAADVATKILDGTEPTTVVENKPTGNVSFDDVGGGAASKSDVVATNGQGTQGTQGGQGNVYIPQQSFQLGKGRYVDGVPTGPFSGGPMVGYNPNNTYMDYEKIKNKNNMFGNKYKSVRKFSHHFPGQMEYENRVSSPGMNPNAEVGNPAAMDPNSKEAVYARELAGLEGKDLRVNKRNLDKAYRQGIESDFFVDDNPTPTTTSTGVGPDGAPNPTAVEAEKQKAAVMQEELMGGYDAFMTNNPDATEEQKAAYVQNSRAAMMKKMEGFRPDASYTGGMTEFLRQGDPNDILTNSTYQQGAMMRMDEDGNEYFQYPGTPYVYGVTGEEDEEGNMTGAGVYNAIEDPEVLEKFRTMNPGRSSEGSYYDYDPIKGMEVPRADFVPMQYNEDGSRIESYDEDSDYGRQEDAFSHFQAGDHEGKIKRSDFADEQDYYNALQIPDGPLSADEAAQLGFTKNESTLSPFSSEAEVEEKRVAQDKIDNPRRYLSGEEAMGELTNPDLEGVGMFTKENRKGERKFDYRDMRKEGFKGKEIRNIKRAVKDFDENTEMTGDSEFAMGEVERAYEEGNEGRGQRFRKKNKKEYGGQSTWQDVVTGFDGDYYIDGGNYYVNGGPIPMYVDAGETGIVPPIGGDMTEVQGIDGGGFDYSWNMGPQPTNPYAQPQQYEVADESLNTPQNPGDMSLNLQGTYKPGAKFADTTQKRKSTPFGDPIKNLSKFIPAGAQVAAAFGNAMNDPNAQARIEQGTSADYAFTPDRTWTAGTDAGYSMENKVGLPTPAIAAPVQYTGGAGRGQYGGQFQLGGAYTLNDKDIADILAMGGQIEYLD
jgi:hypothetical protein